MSPSLHGIRFLTAVDGVLQASPRPAPGFGQQADGILADPAWGRAVRDEGWGAPP